jgi:hypothetical protein
VQQHKGALALRGNERCLGCAYFRTTAARSNVEKQAKGYCSLFRWAVSIWGVCEKWSAKAQPDVIAQFESKHARPNGAPPLAAESCPECGGRGHVRGKCAGHRVVCPACRSARENGQLALFQLKPYNKPKPRETD